MQEESKIVICPNPKCGREIEEPILLTNLTLMPMEQYEACPNCFSKIIPETPIEAEELTSAEEDEALETSRKAGFQVLKKVEDLILVSGEIKEETKEMDCPEKFGYLANRPKDAPIPPECLMCTKMVDCMLRAKK